jgi:hypothetical protein
MHESTYQDLQKLISDRHQMTQLSNVEIKVLAHLHFQPSVPRLIVLTQVKAFCKMMDCQLEELIGEEALQFYQSYCESLFEAKEEKRREKIEGRKAGDLVSRQKSVEASVLLSRFEMS